MNLQLPVTEHPLMKCPACGEDVIALIDFGDVGTNLEPVIESYSSPLDCRVTVSVRIERFDVRHRCKGRQQ